MGEAGFHLANDFGEMFLQGFTDASVASVASVSGVSDTFVSKRLSGTTTSSGGGLLSCA